VSQHQHSAALLRAKGIPYCPVLVCRTSSQHACVTEIHLGNELAAIKVCSEPTAVLCSTAQGTMHFPLFSVALQNRLAACLCHREYTSEDSLLEKECNEPTPILCSIAQDKTHSPLFSAALQNRACVTAGTAVEIFSSNKCSADQAHSRLVSLL